jgi:hypothetical protein
VLFYFFRFNKRGCKITKKNPYMQARANFFDRKNISSLAEEYEDGEVYV